MITRRFAKWVGFIAVIHLFLSIVTIVGAFGTEMARFGNAAIETGVGEKVLGALASVLPQPAMSLLQTVGARDLSPIAQWAALGANSIVWALGLAWIICHLTQGRVDGA